MHIAVTANGPGEVAGWVRPLLRALYARRPDLEVTVFLVPDDYASGYEAKMLRDIFPHARVVRTEKLREARVGRAPEGPAVARRRIAVYRRRSDARRAAAPPSAAAARPRISFRGAAIAVCSIARLRWMRATQTNCRHGARLPSASRPSVILPSTARCTKRRSLRSPERRMTASLMMPGSRRYEVENLVPFYFAVALRILRERPVPMAFALSPFTTQEQVRAAIEGGGHPRMFGRTGRLRHARTAANISQPMTARCAFRFCATLWPPRGVRVWC